MQQNQNMQKSIVLALIILFIKPSFSQSGEISGIITDALTGETLPGATILIDGTTKGSAADFDGKFVIRNVMPGTYNLVINYITYNTKRIPDVRVSTNSVTSLKVQLEPSASQELQAVEVVVTLNKENNTALALQQKNAACVSDGISAETIRKTPDRNTSDVLKRVSGTSIQENKFPIIRGLNDRYNTAFINGSPLPSSESDRRAFAFDIFPSNMLDNLVIIKTATPDMPGEFAGGIISINTKSIPQKDFQMLSIGTSLHTLTTFKNFKTYRGGKLDFLGVDDGTRTIPEGIPDTKHFEKLTADEKAEKAKLMTPSWKINEKNALPAINLQYSLGKNLAFGNKKLGFLFAYTYQNGFIQNQSIRREFEESATGVILRAELNDEVHTKSVLNSGLLNLAFKINDNNQISFKNIYSINSSDKVQIRSGARELDNDPHQYERSSNRLFTQNLLYTGQLEGEHFIPESRIRFKWTSGFSDVNREIPNMRRVVYQKQSTQESDTGVDYAAVVQNNGTIPTAAGNMFWSDTQEKLYSMRYQASAPVNIKTYNIELKAGAMHQFRKRSFAARNLGFSRYRKTSQPSAPFDNELLLLPEDEIFSAEHLGLQANGMGGFKLEEATKVHDSYNASSLLNAAFIMADSRVTEELRIIFGARLESYNQKFAYTQIGTNQAHTTDTTVADVLPSINMIYSFSSKTNIRASYYRTVSRPEFRELAPFQFYNFELDNILSGLPHLQRCVIENADLRYEYYPGSGQLLSISGFYKYFKNPIELYQRAGTAGAAELSYTNVPHAVNYGAELEYRFKLNFLIKNDSNFFFSNSTLFTNVALVRSKVDVSQIPGSRPRPLQGQSPFIINAGLIYTHPTQKWSASASYNIVGRRIYITGNVQEPDIWEKGRNVIDLQFSKNWNERIELRLNIKDLLAQTQLFYQNVNSKEKFEDLHDNRWQETTFGRTISINLSYRF